MPRKYVRKTSRQSWSLSSLQSAIRAVEEGLAKGTAARIYGIPKKTLLRYIAKGSEVPVVAKLGRFTTVLSRDQEEEIVNHAVLMSQSAIGMNHKDIRELAYQIAEKYAVPHGWKDGLAGVDWLRNFLKRHTDLKLRKVENTSLARLTGFNRESVRSFFNLLTTTMVKGQYSPEQVWNVDETGFSTVQSRPMKVFAKKGQRQVAAISSAERGTNTTVILAMSASGDYVPPAFVFPRARLTEALKSGAPDNSLFLCNPSGWSTIETCSAWFDHFLRYAKPTAGQPILLILDGHSSHTKNIHMLEKASASNVRILSIPPHTSHKLQPLYVSVMGPVKGNMLMQCASS
ncbi:tigger transposable element-derived protein 6-like [Armigeres subalbatus]|uniref:tigger transposable element-derived protein 6-like n=1 Tax=Armigeres subalbatus TaxID=124917 RepID=UPI002ED4E12E